MTTPNDGKPREWRSVEGFPGYEVCADGLVRSWKYGTPRVMKTRLRDGYPSVTLSHKNKGITLLVHRMVMLAFGGPAPEGCECAHLNGNREDCRLANLKWTTRAENHSHRLFHGTDQRGSRNPFAKLNETNVSEIRQRAMLGEKQRHLAQEFGVSEQTVSQIIKRKVWNHI